VQDTLEVGACEKVSTAVEQVDDCAVGLEPAYRVDVFVKVSDILVREYG
jgi:hypothetical protein